MKSIEELQADVKKLYQELEERKKMEEESVPQTVDFHALSSKAQRYAIEGHPMSGCDEHTQQMYLMVLLSVAAMDDNVYADSFCTIYRIAHGMRFQGDIQELFLSAQQMNFSKLDECTRLFQNDDKRLLLVLECLLVTGSFDAGRKRAMEYIAELCILMKLTKEEMQFLSGLARVVLTQDISQYNCKIMNTYGTLFDCYLDMLEEQIEIEAIWRSYEEMNLIKFNSFTMYYHHTDYTYGRIHYEIKNKNYNLWPFAEHASKPEPYSFPLQNNHFIIKYANEIYFSNFSPHTQKIIALTINTPLAYSKAICMYADSFEETTEFDPIINAIKAIKAAKEGTYI